MSLEKKISALVESQFPEFYREQGPLFVQFVKAYYQWMETEGMFEQHAGRLLDYIDIDRTLDDFIIRFKEKYLPEIEFTVQTDKRHLLKRLEDLIASRGSEEGVALFLNLTYGEQATVFRPSDQILRPSDGRWYEPKYLELSLSTKASTFPGKNITGAQSQATAFAERLTRKRINGNTIDVLYISNIKGAFVTGEPITSDGMLDDCPVVIGSLTTIDLADTGKNFNVGDVVDVVSTVTGSHGQARVEAVAGATGRVDFNLVDGGWGFSNNATVYVSEQVASVTSKTYTATVNCNSMSGPTGFVVGDTVYGYGSGNVISGVGYVYAIPSAYTATPAPGSDNQQISIRVTQGVFKTETISSVGTTGNTVVAVPTGYTAAYEDFLVLESVYQPLATVECISLLANTGFAEGDFVTAYDAVPTPVGTGYVVGSPVPYDGTTNTQTIKLIVQTGTFNDNTALTVAVSGNTVNAIIGSYTNTTATGVMVGTTNTMVGIANVQGSFTTNTAYCYVYGGTSNVYANVAQLFTGVGANFDVGLLTNTEKVYLNTDLLNGTNVANVPYMQIKINALFANVGFIEDVNVIDYASNSTYIYASGGGTLYSEGQGTIALSGGTATTEAAANFIAANGVLYSITTTNHGTLYSNNQALVFTGTSRSLTVTTQSGNTSVTVNSANDTGLYAGLAIEGTGVPANTFISAVTSNSSSVVLTLSNPATGTATNAVMAFPARGYITTNNSGAIVTAVITSQGSGYSSNPGVTVSGGTTGTAAVLTASVANGVIVDTIVYQMGSGYDSAPTATATTSGTAAQLAAIINPGYGFPKAPQGDLKTPINDLLTRGVFDIGTIYSLTNINLGKYYNHNPFVVVVEKGVAGFNRRDIIINHTSSVNFIVGELITQQYNDPRIVVSYINAVPGEALVYEFGEIVVQEVGGVEVASGTIVEASGVGATGALQVKMIAGTFTAGGAIRGLTTGVTATIDTTYPTEVVVTVRGIVKDNSAPYYITVGRRSFNVSFNPNVQIVGSVSKIHATVLNTTTDPKSLPIGMNALITAKAGVASGTISQVSILDSGFAYKQDEYVTLRKAENQYTASGYVNLLNQGQGTGYFISDRGFLNNNYLHDNRYWQEYSYEVRVGIPLSRYADVLKRVCHVAGTQLFGTVAKSIEVLEDITLKNDSAIVSDDVLLNLSPVSGSDYTHGEPLRIGTTLVGYANGPVQSTFTTPGYVDTIRGHLVSIPNGTSAISELTIFNQFYDATSNTTEFYSSGMNGLLPIANNTGEALSNTFIITVPSTAGLVVGDTLFQLSTSIVTPALSNTYVYTARPSVAYYRNAAGNMDVSPANALRPRYSNTGAFDGLLLEPGTTNMVTNSEDLTTSWTGTNVTIASNDILSPLGAQTVDKIIGVYTPGSGINHGIQRSIQLSNNDIYTFSAFFKASEVQYGALILPASRFTAGVEDVVVTVNALTGQTNIVSGSSSISQVLVEMYGSFVRVGVSAAAVSNNNSGTFYVRLAQDMNTVSFGTSLNSQGMHVWGVQLEHGLLSSYVPTSGGVASRSADSLVVTDAGWASQQVVAGTLLRKDTTHLVVKPCTTLTFARGSNNQPLVEGSTFIQENPDIIASGTLVYANTTSAVITTDKAPFRKYNKDFKSAANTSISSAGVSAITMSDGFANGSYITSRSAGASTIVSAQYNSDAQYDVLSFAVNDPINTLRVSYYNNQAAVGDQLVGNTSGTTAVIQTIQR